MKKSLLAASFILSFSTFLMAQSGNTPPVSTVVTLLPKAIESTSATVGQGFTMITLTDVLVRGETVIPRGSEVFAEISQIVPRSKDGGKCVLAIKVLKAVTKGNREIDLQAIIAAIGAPRDTSLSGDPLFGMMHSNEPKMSGSTTAAVTASGSLPANSSPNSTAPIATAQIKGRMDESLLLNEGSQGAIGYEDLSLSWSLIVPPPLTVVTSKGKSIKLKAGSQMLLRMAEPHLPK